MSKLFRRALTALSAGHDRPASAAERTLLILGHSHVQCLIRALAPEMSDRVEIHDINETKELFPPRARDLRKQHLTRRAPDVVCICLGGNYHNQFGLVENPVKFGCGLADGTMPDMTDRQPIPYALVKDQFEARFAPQARRYEIIHSAFPNARFLHFSPPPPIGDWDHIRAHPGVFRKFLPQGPMPSELRLEFYALQTGVYRGIAADRGADFLLPPDETRNAEGFLAPAFFNSDPTHGNTAYGKLMLKRIYETAGMTP